MPLRDDLLSPIPGGNPSGQNLRYDRVYEQINEARQEDDESLPMGAWQRAAKKADLKGIVKVAGDALASKSKDLWLVAWLTEALFRQEGFPTLAPCLLLTQEMQTAFWDTCYPPLDEDGDAGLRCAPLQWMANRLSELARQASITNSGLNSYKYRESRIVGYEADADSSESRREARTQAIADGKVTAEDFDLSFQKTPKAYYQSLEQNLQNLIAQLDSLSEFHEVKYGDDGPTFTSLKTALEEIHVTSTVLLNEKRKLEPDEETADSEAEAGPEREIAEETSEVAQYAAPQAPVRRAAKTVSSDPGSEDEAIARLKSCALFLGAQDGYSPVPYLVCSAVRFGETRKAGSSPDLDFLQSPLTEVRQALRRLANDENWDELMAEGLSALCEPCGRVWLDLQRYLWLAARGKGADATARSIASTTRALLLDFPEMRAWTLNDDTPAANAATQQWIDSEILPPQPAEPTGEEIREAELHAVAPAGATHEGHAEEEELTGTYDMAMELFRKGRQQQAIEMLVQDSEQQPSGRLRFLRRVQVAQLCLAAGRHSVAYPVLTSLWKEIERRGLEGWESGETLAQPLNLLLKCMDHRKGSEEDREVIFSHLCRIDPKAAMFSDV